MKVLVYKEELINAYWLIVKRSFLTWYQSRSIIYLTLFFALNDYYSRKQGRGDIW